MSKLDAKTVTREQLDELSQDELRGIWPQLTNAYQQNGDLSRLELSREFRSKAYGIVPAPFSQNDWNQSWIGGTEEHDKLVAKLNPKLLNPSV